MIKLFEQFEQVAKGYEKKYQETLKDLESIKKLIPSARLEVIGTIGGLPCMWEITCDAHKFADLGNEKVSFAGNVFDGVEDLESVLRDIENAGGSNIEVGNIEIDDYDDNGPTLLRADTLYFDNVPRYLLQPVTEEEREDLEMEPFWSVPSPSELDGGPITADDGIEKGRWHGVEDPYGEEDWDNEKELWTWRAWWD